MKRVYSPGCALIIYKPDLVQKLQAFLNKDQNEIIPEHLVCCRHEPGLEAGTQVINTCTGCDRRFRELYDGLSTISIWEIIAESSTFSFPDYNGAEMSIQDTCPARSQERIHNAVRRLMNRMNIKIVEPINNRSNSKCCGDSLYGALPVQEIKAHMRSRANEMPCEDVAVYCISCIKAMHIGGKKPRYIADLLFGEETYAGIFEPDAWHEELKSFIDKH